MWIFSLSFIAILAVAHVFPARPTMLAMRISEMRSITPLAHLLFALLIGASLCYARLAHAQQRLGSALFGGGLATCILVAWFTPTVSPIHDVFATVPFVALFLYVPVMLASDSRYFAAALALALPPLGDGLSLLFLGPSGALQKVNCLIFIALLNFLYYRVLPARDPF